jgi:hypothetical protein
LIASGCNHYAQGNACTVSGESKLHLTYRDRNIAQSILSSFYADELCDLAIILDIPDPFITHSRFRFTALEALCILLARFKSAGDQYDLQKDYCRAQSAISEVVNELCGYLNGRWSHLLGFDSEHLLSRRNLACYARAAYRRGAPVRTIWGFIDCTIVVIKRFTHLNIRQLYWSTASLLTYLDPKSAATIITTSLHHLAFWRNVQNMPSIQIPPCLHCGAASSYLGTLHTASALS